ncbi:MAG TPA: class I SAM-dependent methyltransferase [Acidimicrobiia bacterium]|nr:class I SAM-dependent methyltransferase [Acidimicrobiia bacterium]
MRTTAREAWREHLESWALPGRLLDSVDESPYGWPAHLFERGGAPDTELGRDSPTVALVDDILGDGGSVLDVGAGAGRLSIPLAALGHRVTAVERDEGMARALGAAADREKVEVTRIVGSWPQVAGNAHLHDVALSAHVVYDIAAIGPFIDAMHRGARRAVVIEMTPRHPWTGLSRYYRALHGLDRPSRPTVDDFAAVVEEVTGVTPERRWWVETPSLRFTDMQELLVFYRRRLLVPPERSIEAAALLEPDVHELEDGRLVLGDPDREVVGVWWKTRSPVTGRPSPVT